jgi:hypothetical protein
VIVMCYGGATTFRRATLDSTAFSIATLVNPLGLKVEWDAQHGNTQHNSKKATFSMTTLNTMTLSIATLVTTLSIRVKNETLSTITLSITFKMRHSSLQHLTQ